MKGKRKPTTYNNITTRTTAVTTTQDHVTRIDSNTHAKIFAYMMHTHFMNAANPGCFEVEVNKKN